MSRMGTNGAVINDQPQQTAYCCQSAPACWHFAQDASRLDAMHRVTLPSCTRNA